MVTSWDGLNRVETSKPYYKTLYEFVQSEYAEGTCYPPAEEIMAAMDLTPLDKVKCVILGQDPYNNPTLHPESGWQKYTDAILEAVDAQDRPIAFLLWGRFARNKACLLHNPKHLVLQSPHPSPYSAGSGFFGNGHFKKCNQFLSANGVAPIDWRIPD